MFTKLIDFVKKAIAKIKFLSGGTILRTILLMLVYINQLVALIGSTVMVFAENPIYQWISLGLTIAITIVAYWYNNDWTNIAQITGEIFNMLKDGKITNEEICTFIDRHKTKVTTVSSDITSKTETKTEDKTKKSE